MKNLWQKETLAGSEENTQSNTDEKPDKNKIKSWSFTVIIIVSQSRCRGPATQLWCLAFVSPCFPVKDSGVHFMPSLYGAHWNNECPRLVSKMSIAQNIWGPLDLLYQERTPPLQNKKEGKKDKENKKEFNWALLYPDMLRATYLCYIRKVSIDGNHIPANRPFVLLWTTRRFLGVRSPHHGGEYALASRPVNHQTSSKSPPNATADTGKDTARCWPDRRSGGRSFVMLTLIKKAHKGVWAIIVVNRCQRK